VEECVTAVIEHAAAAVVLAAVIAGNGALMSPQLAGGGATAGRSSDRQAFPVGVREITGNLFQMISVFKNYLDLYFRD
jgi:hypothetical protein